LSHNNRNYEWNGPYTYIHTLVQTCCSDKMWPIALSCCCGRFFVMAASEGMNEMSTHTQSVRPFLVTCLDNYHDLLLLFVHFGFASYLHSNDWQATSKVARKMLSSVLQSRQEQSNCRTVLIWKLYPTRMRPCMVHKANHPFTWQRRLIWNHSRESRDALGPKEISLVQHGVSISFDVSSLVNNTVGCVARASSRALLQHAISQDSTSNRY
jgi:hypothetical protein